MTETSEVLEPIQWGLKKHLLLVTSLPVVADGVWSVGGSNVLNSYPSVFEFQNTASITWKISIYWALEGQISSNRLIYMI